RVTAHLQRWNIAADDTAGRVLSQTAAGSVMLLMAEIMAERAAPVPLMALLAHPLAGAGEGRALWLERARALERRLRGPRPGPGLAAIADQVARLARADKGIGEWWADVSAMLDPLLAVGHDEETSLADLLDMLAAVGERLCGEGLWAN